MGDPVVPESLRASATRYWDAEGASWADLLPAEIARACTRWGLRLLRPLPGASTAFVAEVERGDGSVAILKISHSSIVGEGAALRAYGGVHAIALLDEDDRALLLERCVPGTALRRLADTDRVFQVTLDFMARLWEYPPPRGVPPLAEHGARLVAHGRAVLERLPELRRSVVADGIEALAELLARPSGAILLHGDLHPGNILSATRSPFLVTDPKPLVGDPAYETTPLLVELGLPKDDQAAAVELARRVRIAGERLGIDAQKIATWGLARRSDWALFCYASGDKRRARVAEREAELFARICTRSWTVGASRKSEISW